MKKTAPETPVNFATLPPYLTCAEVRKLLRCSERTLRRYYRGDSRGGAASRPILGYAQRVGTTLFAKAEIERFLSRRTVRVE